MFSGGGSALPSFGPVSALLINIIILLDVVF